MPPTPNDFISILSDLDEGNVSAHLTEQLRRMTLAVLQTGKDGELTLKLKLKPQGKTLVLDSKINARVPQADTEPTVFFADKEGYLHQHDPLQQELRGVVTKASAPLRSVDRPAEAAATTPAKEG